MDKAEKFNRNYKSSVFASLFHTCSSAKKNALSLINALHGTDIADESRIEHIDLESSIYVGLRNDVSFMLDDRLIVLVEHQSTVNNNMPLRSLMYIARLYERLTDIDSRYRKKLIKIPTPEIYVFYNGDEEQPVESIMKLSDSFIELKSDFALDLTVKVVNINPKCKGGSDLLDKCKVLKEYSELVEIFKGFVNDGNSRPAHEAIKLCIKKGILVDFLAEEGDEVENWLFAEYDRDADIRIQREEAAEEATEKATEETTDRINQLNQRLLADNRYDDLKKSFVDKEFQHQLMVEYRIID